MSDFKKRLKVEKEELEIKIKKLNAFLGSDKINCIDFQQKDILKIQVKAMETYLTCLNIRLGISSHAYAGH